jgi:hypothetical protein
VRCVKSGDIAGSFSLAGAWLRCLTAVLVAAVVGVLGSTSAFGSVSHPFVGVFEGSESPAGDLTPSGTAVDGSGGVSAGDVYVVDEAHSVIDKFTAAGEYVCQITGAGSLSSSASECDRSAPGPPSGPFEGLHGIAVDSATGDVYVVNLSRESVDVFGPEGAYLSQITGLSSPNWVAVNNTSGDVYISNSGEADVKVFDPHTLTLSTFASGTSFGGIAGVAVDNSSGASAGEVYVVNLETNVVDRFSPTGTLLGTLTELPSSGPFEAVRSLAVDPVSGDVYVDVFVDGGASGVVGEFSASGGFLGEISGGETLAGSMTPASVAIAPTGKVYVADSEHLLVNIFGAGVVIPDALTGAAAPGVTASAATVEGVVNPEGLPLTGCRFEWGTSASYGHVSACSPAAGSISSEQTVTAALTELASGTVYHFRLVVSNANGTVSGLDGTFETSPTAVVEGERVANLSEHTAELVADVNPRAVVNTRYSFEWGTTASYGHVEPAFPGDEIMAGSSNVEERLSLVGLKANTTYHWRVVAHDANGTTEGPDQTFVFQTVGASLPDGRAYELVTPARKNGALFGDLFDAGLPVSIADDGSRVIASAIQCLEGSVSCTIDRGMFGTPYEFTRTGGGWQSTPLAPPASEFEVSSAWAYNATSGVALFTAPTAISDEFLAREADGTVVSVGPVTSPTKVAHGAGPVPHETADLSHLVWSGPANWPFTASNVFEYVGVHNSSQPYAVGVVGGEASTVPVSVCGTLVEGVGAMSLTGSPGPSGLGDGKTVFFIAQACPAANNGGVKVWADTLYARVDNGEVGAHTVDISEPGPSPQCSDPACVANTTNVHQFRTTHFGAAAEDGTTVYFTSAQQLTNTATQDKGMNLYEYDLADEHLTDISAGDTSGDGPLVDGVVAVSADGSHAYFVAGGVLASSPNSQGQFAVPGADNLYVADEGHVAFIGDLASGDEREWDHGGEHYAANVSPEGRYLLFTSRAHLTADDSSASEASQVFHYDSQTGVLTRISIGNNGYNNDGNDTTPTPCVPGGFCSEDDRIVPGHFGQTAVGELRRDPSMSDDGSYVFFESPLALTPNALNDVEIDSDSGVPLYAENVYEWHEGHVSLISDGHDISDDRGQYGECETSSGAPEFSSVCLLGTDTTGSNVFFSTADALVPQDVDSELDYYDARICTPGDPCIPAPPAATECSESACHNAPAPAPGPVTAASISFDGPGDIGPAGPSSPVAKIKVLSHKVSSSGFLLTVSAPAKGTITIKSQNTKTLHRTISTPGTYRFAVSLTAKARAALRARHKHQIKLRLQITYTPTGHTPQTTTLSLTAKP